MQTQEQLESWSEDITDLPNLQFQGDTECFSMPAPMTQSDSFSGPHFDDNVASLPECCFEADPSSPPALHVQCDLEDSRPSSPFNYGVAQELLEEDELRNFTPSVAGSVDEDDLADSADDGELSTPSTKISMAPKTTKVKSKKDRAPRVKAVKVKQEVVDQVCVGGKRDKPDSATEEVKAKTEGPRKRGPIVRPLYKCGKCGQMKKGHVCPTAKEEQMISRVFQLPFVMAARAVAVGNGSQMNTPMDAAQQLALQQGWQLAFALGGGNPMLSQNMMAAHNPLALYVVASQNPVVAAPAPNLA
eukprot:CAMPEP_0114553594 /NCGR_PEP_ID=MMETSP0114-20121206/7747_1 /TAXON_ID=31324 /ORGANISM="Goniomonas sp, Strain m" /LENGTH=301 /DNA_ID=CAMNT_0001738559 /DNA_START=58 /DNA_END=963 /DNA_ORIENTATION=-